MLALCQKLRDNYNIAAVTNDIFTKEDGEFLVKNKALDPERIARCCYDITDAEGVYSFCAFNNLYRFPDRGAARAAGA